MRTRVARGKAVTPTAPQPSVPPRGGGSTGDPGEGARGALEARLGVRFRDARLLRTALTHPSYANEHPAEVSETNERLEFLGDAALGLIVAETLYGDYPELEEGRLTEWRAQLVCGPTLARVATRLGLGEALLLGRGEDSTGGRLREGNLERAFEALVGAVLLDQGLDGVRAFARRALAEEFAALDSDPALLNPKGALQQLVQGVLGRPQYVTTHEEGPEHARRFTIEVRVDGETVGSGAGPSKQVAEKEAARRALVLLRARLPLAAGDAPAQATG
ncbi:MAG: ribonuclease III [Chloroflexi bacterium]|nr:ribonuclease III [Chloroflexota bacterium]